MSSRTIYDCDSCKGGDIQPISFDIPVPVMQVDKLANKGIEHVDVCPGCAERLLKSMMGGLDPAQGAAIFKTITKTK